MNFIYICTRKGINMLSEYLKKKRKSLNLTQEDLASKAGVGLRVVREMEQGKPTLRMDKVNQVLMLFGAELGVVLKVKNDE
ncbi:helix-turn-helix transcriptional regulator [Mucilaginibacter pineti]|nr:helix-turn-helix transcriptional regulator [Mucilaginibacter pineti]